MSDTCVFCGYSGEAFDPEHWIPQWLSRALIPTHGTGVLHNLPGQPSWEANVFELTVPHVCAECNHHWLSDIEGRAKRYILPLILGIAGEATINPQGLWHVARWCYLKVISLELGRPHDHRPTHDTSVYAAFKNTKQPPYPNCSLALGMRNIDIATEPNPVFVWFTSQGLRFAPSVPARISSVDGYHTTLLIGHLIIDVFGATPTVYVDPEHGEGLHVLWPVARVGGTFTWPPTKRFRWRDGLELD